MEMDRKKPRYAGKKYNFDPAAAHYNARPDYPEIFYRELERRMSQMSSRRFVDLGCGDGRVAMRIANWGAEVIGVDHSRQMIATALRRSQGQHNVRVEFILAEAVHLPFAPATIDVILTGQALHWMRRDLAAREVARTLRPGGLWIVFWSQPTIPWSLPVCITDNVISAFIPEYNARSAHELTAKSRIPVQVGFQVETWTTRFTRPYRPEDYVAMVANKSYVVNTLSVAELADFKTQLSQELVRNGFFSKVHLPEQLTVHFAERV
jgi:ubiquinone/menaquinone biosynthesis C-methylase UbiE